MIRILKCGSRVILLVGAQLKDFLISVINGLNVKDDSSGCREDSSSEPCLTYNSFAGSQDSSYEQQANNQSFQDSSGQSGGLREDSSSTGHQDSLYEQQADNRSLHLGDSVRGLRANSSSASLAMTDNSSVRIENTSACCRENSFVFLQREEGLSGRSQNGRLETTTGRVTWSTDLVHYVKLGEMDAYICCFVKEF